VQGVFFRDATRRAAELHGLAGWVANREDGAVEVWLEGPPHGVDAVARWCHQGPSGADVSRVEVEDVSPEGVADFSVR
jgi:acylphosphatase